MKQLFVAQIEGFTFSGSVKEIQAEWDSVKKQFSRILNGKELKFFDAEISDSGCIVVANFKPVKTFIFNC